MNTLFDIIVAPDAARAEQAKACRCRDQARRQRKRSGDARSAPMAASRCVNPYAEGLVCTAAWGEGQETHSDAKEGEASNEREGRQGRRTDRQEDRPKER